VSGGSGKNTEAMCDLTLRHRLICGIPALELFARIGNGKQPLVIMIHGFEAAKEHVLPYAYRLAEKGFYTVFFDAREHGERAGPAVPDASPLEKKARLYELSFATAADIDTVIDDYSGHPRADAGRIGLVGFSMGGMTIYRYAAGFRRPGVKAAVPVIATPAFTEKLKHDMAADPDLAALYDEKSISGIADRDPRRHPARMTDLPLLILNGTADELMPVDHVRAFYREMKALYSRKELIRMIEYPGIGHLITAEMMIDVADWLKRYL